MNEWHSRVPVARVESVSCAIAGHSRLRESESRTKREASLSCAGETKSRTVRETGLSGPSETETGSARTCEARSTGAREARTEGGSSRGLRDGRPRCGLVKRRP